ncbi:N-6 DNA methylase [Leuconostoc pseudomesenteroides]|uniref:N-6 DNA methylase n=1 Tax=Leuconostoc pseudomesenteroides TaxID=33968 RepID=UPI0039E98AEC
MGRNRHKEDSLWAYGVPQENNINYAWIKHIVSKLKPNGKAGFMLTNGSFSKSTKE